MRTRRVLADIFLGFFAILLAISAILTFYFQTSFVTVTSRSMEPTIKAGDTLLARQIKTEELRPRDIAILPVPDIEGLRFTHRITSIKMESGDVIVTTKGDGNPNPDTWSLQITSQEVPKVIAIIPTAAIFNGPIERRWIYYGLFYGGAALGLFASWRLVTGKSHHL